MKTYAILNDIHYPFHDAVVVDLVLKFLKDLKPNGVVLNGDIVDCYPISRFDKKPFDSDNISHEVALAEKLMKTLKKITEDVTWLGGNHEDRCRKHIWKNREVFAPLSSERGIKLVRDLCFEKLYGLDEYDVGWLEYKEGVKLGKLYVTHGEVATRYTAAKNLAKYNVSVITGHNHRKENFSSTSLAGEIGSWTNGCLCTLSPEWIRNPDWQQCFAVVHVDKDGTYCVQQMAVFKDSRGRPFFFYGPDRVK